jgi:hypothetical protein
MGIMMGELVTWVRLPDPWHWYPLDISRLRPIVIKAHKRCRCMLYSNKEIIYKPPYMVNLYRTRVGPQDLATYKEGPGEIVQGQIEIRLVILALSQ